MNSPVVPARNDMLPALACEGAARADPFGILTSLVRAQLAWLAHPAELAAAAARFSSDALLLQGHAWMRALGVHTADVVEVHGEDTRFRDPAWRSEAPWAVLKQWYLLVARLSEDCAHCTPGLSHKERRRAAFWTRNILNALAPTNFFATNPAALRKAVETHGESVLRGMRNFLHDARAGSISMVDLDAFRVGHNLATTPGKVVFRNDLLEVIHYTPTVALNHERPIVIVTPWINKYYVLDLRPEKSMVKFLLDQGFSVFITSWKNPGPTMAHVAFADYVTQGVGAIVDCARETSGARDVHAVGYCIGGVALSIYLARVNRRRAMPDIPVATVTLLTTLIDYEEPGDIEVFLDDASVTMLSRTMTRTGFLDGSAMASAFRLLRSNGLIWHYFVLDYLYGETPPPLDVLYWNMDTTRMPATMHEWYLRELYLENKLVRGAIEIDGDNVDLGAIVQPLYAVAAEDDHIAPWRSAFRVNEHVSGPRRFVLSSSGHILGIVNPVITPPKRRYRAGEASRSHTADGWRAATAEQSGSWWEDWVSWLRPQSGELRPAGAIGSQRYPVMGEAPGTYVFE